MIPGNDIALVAGWPARGIMIGIAGPAARIGAPGCGPDWAALGTLNGKDTGGPDEEAVWPRTIDTTGVTAEAGRPPPAALGGPAALLLGGT